MEKRNIIAESIASLEKYGISSVAVAAGVFDGVHRGHLQVIRAMIRIASASGATPCVLTFSPHPKSVLPGKKAPLLLIPKEEKYELLLEAGAEAIVEIRFTREFASLTPEQFLNQCLHAGGVCMTGLSVGASWRFGSGASGDISVIERFAAKEHFLFTAVPEFLLDGRVVSSSRIRHAVSTGAVEAARRMLGRRPAVYGTVVHGMGLAGKLLGYPTANIEIECGVPPAFGVYAVFAVIDGTAYPGVANTGVAPTIRREENPMPRFEVHIPGFSDDLYGKKIKVELVGHLRPEKKFQSPDDLRRQMGIDLDAAMRILCGKYARIF